MKITIASGKGGTGKTTVATNLAVTIAGNGGKVCYADCDVEEPNGHIFLKPVMKESRRITVPVPRVDTALCRGCGLCGKMCRFNAIVSVGGNVLVFPELCHGCGGCSMICPEMAIREDQRDIGFIEFGTAGDVSFIQGRLRIGEPMSSHLVSRVKESLPDEGITIIDAPPGTSCPVIKAVQGVDLVILVTEPTPFGLNDLKLAVGLVDKLNIPHGVIINKHDIGNDSVKEFCRERAIDILTEIPCDRLIAEACSRGELLSGDPGLYDITFRELAARIFGKYVFEGIK